MKIVNIVLKVVLSLILLMPVLGTFGFLGEATRDLYNTDLAFSFISLLMQVGYINYMMVAVNIITIIALWTRREALGALLIAPITANVVGFHLFIDGGLFTAGAVIADILLLLNAYFLWKNRAAYQSLLTPRA
jgi:hypothetical protein